jgi:predicted MFS family arabinose efflux permease
MRARITLLAAAMFVIGTDGFVVAGLLRDISTAAGVAVTVAGQLITVFALTYAVASPVTASLFGTVERKRLMVGAMVVFAAGNALVAATASYPVLFVGRVVAALGAASFTPTALMVAAMTAPPQIRARVISYVVSGLTVATVVGVPLGTFASSYLGYQGVFWVIAGLAVLIAVVLAATFRSVPAPPAVSLRARLRATGLPGVPGTLVVTLIVFVAGFTVYSYIGDLFATNARLTGGRLSWVLLAFGVGGAIGNLAGGRLADTRGVRLTVLLSLTGLAASFVLLATVPLGLGVGCVLAFVWGVSGWLLAPAQQHRLIALGGNAAQLLVSLNSSGMYLGIAVSGVLGALVINLAGVGWLPVVGAVAAVAGLALVAATYPARSGSGSAGTAPVTTPATVPEHE